MNKEIDFKESIGKGYTKKDIGLSAVMTKTARNIS